MKSVMDEWAINLTGVDKVYSGKVHALRGIEMRVRRGEVFGLLGPNGAGKSTLVKILMTVISPTKADGTVLGHRVGHKPTLAKVGYLPEHHKFPEYLTGEQVVDFYAALSGVDRATRRKRTPQLLELVGMKDWAKTKVKGYSKGMRQRVGIAQALSNNPDLVVLDEPTDGVDPVGRRDIREMLTRIKEEGKTVFLNSHLLSELEMVCDRVAILVQGKVASHGTIHELTDKRQVYEIEVAKAGHDDSASLIATLQSGVNLKMLAGQTQNESVSNGDLAKRVGATGQLSTGENVTIDHDMIKVSTADPGKIQPLIDTLRSRGFVIKTVRSIRPSLEDLFMEAVTDPTTGKSLAPGAAKEATKRPWQSGRA
ncbi:MAG: ATP-binding cassette domain-containing protein [Phycisphaerales bacterium]